MDHANGRFQGGWLTFTDTYSYTHAHTYTYTYTYTYAYAYAHAYTHTHTHTHTGTDPDPNLIRLLSLERQYRNQQCQFQRRGLPIAHRVFLRQLHPDNRPGQCHRSDRSFDPKRINLLLHCHCLQRRRNPKPSL
jgi:hypothetical protein